MSRPPLVAVLALQALLVAAVVRPLDVQPYDVDPSVLRANSDIWQKLPDTERDVLRARWARFIALPAGEQETLLQRSDTLTRLGSELAQRQGHEPTAEESATELARIVDGARVVVQHAGAPAPSDAEVFTQMEARTHRCIQIFLDNLARRGHISQVDVARLCSQPLSLQLRDALLLLKAEEIGLYSEGVHAEEADQLLPLSPLDVAARADGRRQKVGFLGLLGQAIPLTDSDRQALDGLTTPLERLEKLRELKAPEIRALLAAHGLSADRIDDLLTGAIKDFERAAQDVLRDSATPAARPAAPVEQPH